VPLLRRLIPTTLLAAAALAPALAPAGAQAKLVAVNPSSSVLVIGDSLAVGLRPYLAAQLGTDVAWDAKSGRTTPQGLVALRSALKVVRPSTVVVSLGTNDGSSPARFQDRINRTLHVIGNRCVVWTNIYRPARKGPYAALNAVLAAEAQRFRRLHLVDWLGAVRTQAVTLPDGLHPDTQGFEYRGKLIADAVKADCEGTATPTSQDVEVDGTGGVVSPA
jgi:lysophospholipase L1-like esterase